MVKNKIDWREININRVWFLNYPYFYLNGNVNCRFCGSKNSNVAVFWNLHPQRLTVWAALCAESMICLIIFQLNVNSKNYLKIVRDIFKPTFLNQRHVSWTKAPFSGFSKMGRGHIEPEPLQSSLDALWPSSDCTWFQKILRMKHELAAILPRFKSLRFFLWKYLKDRVAKSHLQVCLNLRVLWYAKSRPFKWSHHFEVSFEIICKFTWFCD